MSAFLDFLAHLPPIAVYGFLGLGAALENLLPPIPADTFVLLGGFLSARGPLNPWAVWGVTWLLNVGSALAVYGIGHRHGRTFFEIGMGRHALNPRQLERMTRFYQRFGVSAIFLTRFLPGLRSVVPAFAGVSHQKLLPVAIPIATASAIWYGALVWLGAHAGSGLNRIQETLRGVNQVLLAVALLAALAVGWWWHRSRS